MKRMFLLICFLIPFITQAQLAGFRAERMNGADQTTEGYVRLSPGNTPTDSRLIDKTKDSTYFKFYYQDLYFANLPNTVDNGNSLNYLYTDGSGKVQSGARIRLFPDSNLFATLYKVSANYYNKSQSDMRYLQSYTPDSQSVVNAVGVATWQSLLNKLSVETDPLFNTKFAAKSTTDLVEGVNLYYTPTRFINAFNAALTSSAINSALGYTAYNGTLNPSNFLTSSALTGYQTQLSGTGFVKITGTTISYDNSTYLTSVPAQSFASLTGKPTTLSGYGITDGVTSSALTTALNSYATTSSLASALSSYATTSSLASALSSYATTSSLASALAGKFNQPAGTTLQYIRGDGSLATLNTTVVPESGGNAYYTDVRSRAAISITTTGSGAATYNNSTGVLNIPTPATPIPDYYNTITTVSDSAVFYITSDKTSSGTALYTNITYVNPLVNDLNGNYTFGWVISADKKKIVVKARVATNTAVISLLGISLLSSTVPVITGTQIQLLVKGT